MKAGKLPFTVSRDDARSLVDQVTDGLRTCIVTGYWTVGDELPSTRELVPLLGVSLIVTKAAIARLAAEGYVTARLGMKTIVRDRGERQWRGNVLFVYDATNVGYFQTAFAEELRTRLNRAGYLFARATVSTDNDSGVTDYSLIKAALARKADLAVAFTSRRDIFRHLARSEVPFAVALHCDELPPGAVGMTRLDTDPALLNLAEACRTAGIRKVYSVYWAWKSKENASVRVLRNAGIAVNRLLFRPDFSQGHLFGIERAGFEGFRRLIASGHLERDALYYFEDDYLARGALMASSLAGLHASGDFRFAIRSNAGFRPLYERELTRIESDPVASGAAVAEDVLAYLRTGRYPDNTVIMPTWYAGETM